MDHVERWYALRNHDKLQEPRGLTGPASTHRGGVEEQWGRNGALLRQTGWWPAWHGGGISQLSTGYRRSCGHLLLISAANAPLSSTSNLWLRNRAASWAREESFHELPPLLPRAWHGRAGHRMASLHRFPRNLVFPTRDRVWALCLELRDNLGGAGKH